MGSSPVAVISRGPRGPLYWWGAHSPLPHLRLGWISWDVPVMRVSRLAYLCLPFDSIAGSSVGNCRHRPASVISGGAVVVPSSRLKLRFGNITGFLVRISAHHASPRTARSAPFSKGLPVTARLRYSKHHRSPAEASRDPRPARIDHPTHRILGTEGLSQLP